MNEFLERITINPKVCKGRPAIRNMRFTVAELLGLSASGMSNKEIIKDFPYLDEPNIKASLLYAQLVIESKEFIHIEK